MVWAEAFGLGELGLSPREFWSLEYREFRLKHEAFIRAENRALWRMAWLALSTTEFKDKTISQPDHLIVGRGTLLERYPIKPWLA